jgi:hypothetical protein
VKRTGPPVVSAARSGNPTSSASETQSTGNCAPVACCRRRAQARTTSDATAAASSQQRGQHVTGAVAEARLRQNDAAVVEIDFVEDGDALPRRRQRSEHRQIPEQDPEQERQVAHQLHIGAGEPSDDPVGRQPGNADGKAEDRCQRDAEHGDQQRVQQADQEDAGVGVGLVVGNERLADAKAGGGIEEAEARGDALRLQVGAGIHGQDGNDPDEREHQSELVEDAADTGIVVEWRALGRPYLAGFGRHRGLVSGSAARIAIRPWSKDC